MQKHRGRRWLGKTAGGIGFALNFLRLLSFFQEKESNNAEVRRIATELCIRSFKAIFTN